MAIREVERDEESRLKEVQEFRQLEAVDDDPRIPPAPVLSVENLRKWYPLKRGFFETVFSKDVMNVKAVNDVSFSLSRWEIFALSGETASGKTTLEKLLLRLVAP